MQTLDNAQKLLLLEKAAAISQNSYFIIDLEKSTLTWLSKKTEERYGYTHDQLQTMNCRELLELLHPDDRFV
jgi:hypothetical protein